MRSDIQFHSEALTGQTGNDVRNYFNWFRLSSKGWRKIPIGCWEQGVAKAQGSDWDSLRECCMLAYEILKEKNV